LINNVNWGCGSGGGVVLDVSGRKGRSLLVLLLLLAWLLWLLGVWPRPATVFQLAELDEGERRVFLDEEVHPFLEEAIREHVVDHLQDLLDQSVGVVAGQRLTDSLSHGLVDGAGNPQPLGVGNMSVHEEQVVGVLGNGHAKGLLEFLVARHWELVGWNPWDW